MTQNNLAIQFYWFIYDEKLWAKIEALFTNAIESKVIDIEREPAGSPRLTSILYHAILCELARRAKPKDEADLIESENLQRFL